VTEVWKEFLKIIHQEAGSQVVETWFKAVTLHSWDSATNALFLSVPNQFVKKWIQENYTVLMQQHLGRLLHSKNINLIFMCDGQSSGAGGDVARNIIPASTIQPNSNALIFNSQDLQSKLHTQIVSANNNSSNSSSRVRLIKQNNSKSGKSFNENYSFDNFIVGPSNSLAYAAAQAIVENLGKVYNPLFIYGGTGLGKTHLLHAIGNAAQKKSSNIQVCYETTDHFVTEFINCIRFDKADQFRSKYQKPDLLLIDDVQFFSNKEQTQEIFFHIFNNLYENQKQIVMSSDTFPKEIAGLQSRLKSRLEWGLVADVQIPDLETKMAILTKKAEQNKIDLPENVAYFISSCVISNIRELEGALIRVGAFAMLINKPITLEITKKVLLNLNQKHIESASLENVLRIGSKHFNASINDIKSKKRSKDIAEVRQAILYLMKKLSTNSLQVIGSFVGGRDHSTVIHAVNKIEVMIKEDPEFAQKLKIIEQEIMMD